MTPGVDVVGDVHGCYDELLRLLGELGYRLRRGRLDGQAGRQLVFVGDLVDRGPGVAEVLELVMGAAESGVARSVLGNHDERLALALTGRPAKSSRSMLTSLTQLSRRPMAFRAQVAHFLLGLPPRLAFDHGRLLVVHAGDQPQAPPAERAAFNVSGGSTGRRDAYGVKERVDWVTPYGGEALVIYGHTPVLWPDQRRHTINIDTGCVYGGHLTALRYPEGELVSVPARRAYASGARWRALTGQG